jgi:hypothetical protein
VPEKAGGKQVVEYVSVKGLPKTKVPVPTILVVVVDGC